MTVKLERIGDSYRAFLEGQPDVCEEGVTGMEALGRWMLKYSGYFGVDVIVPTITPQSDDEKSENDDELS